MFRIYDIYGVMGINDNSNNIYMYIYCEAVLRQYVCVYIYAILI